MLASIDLITFEYDDQGDDMILLTGSGVTEVFVDHISFINNLDEIILNSTSDSYSQLRMDNDVSLVVSSKELDKLHQFINYINKKRGSIYE